MLRALKKAAVAVGIRKDEEADAAAKHKMQEMKEGIDGLRKAIAASAKSAGEHGGAVAHMHDMLAAVYPPAQAFSPNLESLVGRHAVWSEAKEAGDAARAELEAVLATLTVKHKELSKMVDDRAGLRQDIKHYSEKVHSLEGKPKEAARLEDNKARLVEVQQKFDELDAAVVPLLDSLDKDVADASSAGFKAYLVAERAAAQAVVDALQAALDGVPAPMPEGEAEAAAAAAAGGAGDA